jgi:hypothetical protein
LDEECLLGKGSDATFLEKLEQNLKQNQYFERPREKGKQADDFSQSNTDILRARARWSAMRAALHQ